MGGQARGGEIDDGAGALDDGIVVHDEGAVGRAAPKPAAPRAAEAKTKRATAAAAPAAAAPAPATAPSPGKAAKTRKSGRKTVRDSFNMPREDFVLLDRLKDAAKQAGRPAKKSELIRAGLHALSALGAAALVQALQKLPAVATGRPKRTPDA